jgi:hypothetical protein
MEVEAGKRGIGGNEERRKREKDKNKKGEERQRKRKTQKVTLNVLPSFVSTIVPHNILLIRQPPVLREREGRGREKEREIEMEVDVGKGGYKEIRKD